MFPFQLGLLFGEADRSGIVSSAEHRDRALFQGWNEVACHPGFVNATICARFDRGRQDVVRIFLAEYQNLDLRILLADQTSRLESAHSGHIVVEEDHIRLQITRLLACLRTARGLAANLLSPQIHEEAADRMPNKIVVINKQNSHRGWLTLNRRFGFTTICCLAADQPVAAAFEKGLDATPYGFLIICDKDGTDTYFLTAYRGSFLGIGRALIYPLRTVRS